MIKITIYDDESAVIENDANDTSSGEIEVSSSDSSSLETSTVVDSSAVAVDDETITAVTATISETPRYIMTTPLDEYTVTEGLLLLIVVFLAFGGVFKLFSSVVRLLGG